MGDVNGDGIPDLYSHSNVLFNPSYFPPGTFANVYGVLIGNGSGGFDSIYYYNQLNQNSLGTGKVADVNGDGLADLVFSGNGLMLGCLSTGTGMSNVYPMAPASPNFAMSDLNDDGITDIIFESSGNNYFFSFGNWMVQPADGPTGTDPIILADINGDGRADMIKYNGTSISYSMADGDNAGAGDYLETITNPLGGETNITYGNNTDISNNMVPFELHPVMDIQADDGYNISLTTYDYSDSYYDYAERDFRGFGTVIQTNPDGTTITTTYEQLDDYKKGRPLQVDTKNPSGTLLKRVALTWGTYPATPTTWAFVKLTNKRTDIYGPTNVFTNEAYTYDNTHGGVLATVSSGTGSAENVTFTNAYINKGSWLLRKSSESIEGSSSSIARAVFYTYDGCGNLLTKAYFDGSGAPPVETYTYASYGNIASYKDPKNYLTSYNYDTTETYVTSINYPTTGSVTHSISMTYNDFGKLESETDENGKTTDYYYDDFGRLEQVDYPKDDDQPAGGQLIYEYSDTVNPTLFPAYVKTSVLESVSSYVVSYQYVDGFGRTIMNVSKGESGNSNDYLVTRQYYDEMGRSWKTEGPYFTSTYGFSHTKPSVYPTSEKTFDYMGRVVTVKTPKYQGSQSQFDTTNISYNGFATTITDAKGNLRTEIADYLGRIIEVQEDTGGGTTYYDYNAAGDLVAVEDDEGNITSISYNLLGQKTSMDDPDMGTWSYTYDLNGNLYQQTNAKGQKIRFTYDELNRITLKNYYNTSDPDVYYTYDQATNGIGKLYSVTNGNATTTYNSYDVMGRVTSVTKNITGDTNRTTLFTYDLSGKPVRTTYPDGFWTQNNYYTETNLLNTVTASDGVTYATIGSYSPSGKIKALSHGNGSSTTYTYDDRTESLYEILTKNSYDTIIQQKRYDYTSIGEINSINDLHNSKAYTYTYDNLSRLKTETINGSTTSLSVNYDSIGNITSKTMNGSTFTYYPDSAHVHAVDYIRYNSQDYQYSYDANGNMTYGPDFTNPASPKIRLISYNADNMPASILYDWTVNTTFLYDGMGTRVKKSVGSTHTYYIGDHFEVKGGTTTKYIFAGNLRVAQVKGGVRSYFHKDHLGSSTVMTDNSGGEIESTEYMPFGSQRNHSGTNTSDYRFTDQELDSENGLYNYNARLYDPFIGRFISPDTIVPQPYNPQSLNRYSYCLNNPLIYTDPSGHQEQLTPEIFAALQELWYSLNGLGNNYNNAYEFGASISSGLWNLIFTGSSGLDLFNSGFEELNAWMSVKPLYYKGGGGNPANYSGNGGTSVASGEYKNPYKDDAAMLEDANFVLKQLRGNEDFSKLEQDWIKREKSGFKIYAYTFLDGPNAKFNHLDSGIYIDRRLFSLGYQHVPGTTYQNRMAHILTHEAVESSFVGRKEYTHCMVINQANDIMSRIEPMQPSRMCMPEDEIIINKEK